MARVRCAGMFAALVAGYMTRRFGRKATMVLAGLSFLIGTGLCSGAANLAMLVIGRIFLGIGVGFANQVRLIPSLQPQCAPPSLGAFDWYSPWLDAHRSKILLHVTCLFYLSTAFHPLSLQCIVLHNGSC